MRTAGSLTWRRSPRLATLLLLQALIGGSAARAEESPKQSDEAAMSAHFRLRVGGPAGAALQRTLTGAARRLQRPACLDVLHDFGECPEFRADERLAASGLTPAQYLGVMVFADGGDRPLCRRGDVLAVTAPGSRVVYVCAARFAEAATRDPESTEALLIHEALHSLGLPENPPGSREITRRVLARCGDAVANAAGHPSR
jgi:hypothetical protein